MNSWLFTAYGARVWGIAGDRIRVSWQQRSTLLFTKDWAWVGHILVWWRP